MTLLLVSFRRITYGNRRIYGIVWLNVPNENRLTPLTEIFETEFESRPIPAGLKSKIISIARTSNRVLQPNNAVTDKFTKLSSTEQKTKVKEFKKAFERVNKIGEDSR